MECPICYSEILNEAYSTPCGHIFCGCLVSANFSDCPTCRKPLTTQIHKIYFPFVAQNTGDSMDDAIVQSLVADMSSEKKIAASKFQEIETALENLQLTFSKSDSILESFSAENKLLKTEVEQLKLKIKNFEDILVKTIADQKANDVCQDLETKLSV